MKQHCLPTSTGALALIVGVVSLAATLAAQSPSAARYVAPRTPWGHPDLRGIWDFQSVTPLERPDEFAGREVLPEQEAADLYRRALERLDADRRDGGSTADLARAYNEVWYGRNPIANNRTSLVTDPPDGRVPPMTPEGRRLATEVRKKRGDQGTVAWTEELDSYTRCISRVMPRLPQNYNSGTQIFQTPDYVVLQYEQFDRRIIPLDGRPHIGGTIRQWNGDSRGRWDGNTLVVDTVNFTNKQEFRGVPQGTLHLIERFTRVGPKSITYEATIDDKAMWTRPWTFMLPWQKDDNYQMFEYACHEGNLAMRHILSAQRAEEKAAK
jgi:hypothetical protein